MDEYDDDSHFEEPKQPWLGTDGVMFKRNVLDALDRIQKVGDFATSCALASCPPALSIQGVGPVTMPLVAAQLRQITETAALNFLQAISEIGSDETVGKTLSIDSEHVQLSSGWDSYLQDITYSLAQEMGIRHSIHARLQRMLISGKGATSERHIETQSHPGKFGTLIVALPSRHEGGQVKVTHQSQENILHMDRHPQSFAAWYDDVSHDPLPIESGHQWILAFSLLGNPEGLRPTAALQAVNPEKDALKALLQNWNKKPGGSPSPDHLIYLLDQAYTEAELSLDNLRPGVANQIKVLEQIAHTTPIKIFLSLLQVKQLIQRDHDPNEWAMEERSEESSDDDERAPDDEIETSYRVVYLKETPAGSPVIRNLAFNQDNVVQPGLIADDEPTFEECDEYHPGIVTAWHNRPAVFIIPEDSVEGFLEHSNNDKPSGKIAEYWASKCSKGSQDSHAFQALVRCCEKIWTRPAAVPSMRPGESQISAPCMASILDTALVHQNLAFFEKAAANHQNQLSHMWFHGLRVAIDRHADPDCRFSEIRQGLTNAVLAFTSAERMFNALKAFAGPQDSVLSNPQAEMSKWAKATAAKIADRLPSLTVDVNCADSVLNIVDYLEDPVTYISQKLFPAMEKDALSPRLCLNMLGALRTKARNSATKSRNYQRLYQNIALKFLASCKFEEVLSLRPRPPVPGTITTPSRGGEWFVTPDQLLTFLSDSIEMSADEPNGFLDQVWTRLFMLDYKRMWPVDIQCSWIPLLQGLVNLLPRAGYALTDPLCRELYHSFLEVYIETYVGKPPTQSRSYVRSGVNCSCQDCRFVNAFLADGRQTHVLMAVNQQRRSHIARMLDSARVDYTCQVIKDRSPHKLNIVKSFSQVIGAEKAWIARRDDAVRQLNKIPSLEPCLRETIAV